MTTYTTTSGIILNESNAETIARLTGKALAASHATLLASIDHDAAKGSKSKHLYQSQKDRMTALLMMEKGI